MAVVDAKAWLGYLAISGFLVVASNLICDTSLTNHTDPDWLDRIAAFLSFSGCVGLPAWMSWAIVLIVGGGALFLLGSIIVPILAGAASNAIVGTIISLAIVTGIITLLVNFL